MTDGWTNEQTFVLLQLLARLHRNLNKKHYPFDQEASSIWSKSIIHVMNKKHRLGFVKLLRNMTILHFFLFWIWWITISQWVMNWFILSAWSHFQTSKGGWKDNKLELLSWKIANILPLATSTGCSVMKVPKVRSCYTKRNAIFMVLSQVNLFSDMGHLI